MTEREKTKAQYILKLLGRKRNPIYTVSSATSLNSAASKATASDFEDISDLENIMLELAFNPEFHFNPIDPPIKDGYKSQTTILQEETELSILETYIKNPELILNTPRHLQFVMEALYGTFPGLYPLDANHPWMVYWLINSFKLFTGDERLDQDTIELVNEKISHCIVDDGKGGIAGGANQLGHIASTYAGILSLVDVGNYRLLNKLRRNLYGWFMSLKLPNGSFAVHENGESDVRSCYCVLVIGSLLNILTPELTDGIQDYLDLCQTYEGGFAGVPNTEAHGGYSFCALASYFILNNDVEKIKKSIHLDSLIEWTTQRQGSIEGGLSGRTNKLVDACYSFWIGALFPMLEVLTDSKELFDRDGLYHYILRVAQESKNGGFRDKPGKSVDFYHTNYSLCGLSVCEHLIKLKDDHGNDDVPLAYKLDAAIPHKDDIHKFPQLFNVDKYTVPINPIFGIPVEAVDACRDHFIKLDSE